MPGATPNHGAELTRPDRDRVGQGGRAVDILAPLLLLALALGAWEVWVRIDRTPRWFLPSPSAIARVLARDRILLIDNAWVTLREVLIGFALAVVAGVAIAIVIDASRIVSRALYPIVIASQAVPIVALAPLLLIWFGHGLLPKVIVTALIAFFPIAVNTVDGLRAADRETLDLLRTLGADRWSRFRLVKLPGALPYLFSGARIGIAVAVIGAVFGELVGAEAGLGHLMALSSANLRTDRVFASVVVLSIMAVGLFALVGLAERVALPWRRHVAVSGDR
ncbi:MAG: putative hydroxymethylpyrimidine transport system permease protein [Thermomicrobiales bacterium]|nr:putative hydroxymethylpyrimidine transport system permease protein [Thermomicrobiales bacterium]